MKFEPTAVAGAFLIEVEPHEDERGFFARTWCRRELAERGLDPSLAQCSISMTKDRGTLRGMHYQAAPHEEVKIVRCTHGAIHDVVLDLRPGSRTFQRYAAYELTEHNHRALYVPKGCAHGFQTLRPDTQVLYLISEFYDADAGRGVRWDDPAFGIGWPIVPPTLNARDAGYPDFVLEGGA